MSRMSVAVLALALAALGFGLGYHAGLSHEPPPRAATRAPGSVVAPPSSGISGAVQEALASPDRLERAEQIAQLLQRLGPESIGEVTAAYDALPLAAEDVEIVLLAEWRARLEPDAAFEWARGRAQRTPAALTTVVRSWAERQPEEAARAVGEIENAERRRASVDALVRGWHRSGEPGLLDYLSRLPRGVDRQRAISVATRQKLHRDGVEEAFRWAEALPDDEDVFKLNVFRRVATWATEVDPQRAAAWAARHGEEEHGDGLYRRVGTRWARQDGLAAMTWLATLPAGSRRDVAVQETYRNWVAQDREGAMAWLSGTELEPWLQPALALYVKTLARDDAEQALEWTARIHDAEGRREATMRIGRYWHQVDPDAARAWLDRSGLSEKDREWIVEPPQQRRGRGAAPWQGEVPLPRQEEE